jgi:hypothetical protein
VLDGTEKIALRVEPEAGAENEANVRRGEVIEVHLHPFGPVTDFNGILPNAIADLLADVFAFAIEDEGNEGLGNPEVIRDTLLGDGPLLHGDRIQNSGARSQKELGRNPKFKIQNPNDEIRKEGTWTDDDGGSLDMLIVIIIIQLYDLRPDGAGGGYGRVEPFGGTGGGNERGGNICAEGGSTNGGAGRKNGSIPCLLFRR